MYHELVVPSISGFFAHIQSTPPDILRDAVCDWHIHNEFEVFLLTKGQRIFYVNDEKIVLGEGDLIFINSRIPHKTYAPAGSTGILIQFKTELIHQSDEYAKVSEFLGRKEGGYALFKNDTGINGDVKHCVYRIYQEYDEKSTAYHVFIKAYVYELLACLYRNNILNNPIEFSDTKGIDKIKTALDFIGERYNEQIKLDVISEQLHVEKSYVCRLFRKILGTTFVQYLNYVRTCRAQELLLSTNKNVSEIAYEVGFASVAYFIKCYKKYYGCTPMTYKKILMSSKSEIILQ